MKVVSENDIFDTVRSNSIETFNIPSRQTRHYLEAFVQYQEKGSMFKIIKFNWGAFFFGPFWFLYRKMYLLGFLLLSFLILLEYCFPQLFSVVQSDEFNPIGILSNVLIMLILGFIGTPLYLSLCERRVQEFRKERGTNLIIPLVVSIIFVIITSFIVYEQIIF